MTQQLSMFTPSSVQVEPAIATYPVVTANALAAHIRICSQGKVSGQLDLSIPGRPELMWSLFFHGGRLIWATGEMHPLRRWNRQLLQYCPSLAAHGFQQNTARPQNWDYRVLEILVKQGQISSTQLTAIVGGNILEMFFDVIQGRHQCCQRSEMHLTYRKLPQDLMDSILVSIEGDQAWQQAEQAWEIWQKVGLGDFSPNLAPVVLDDEGLRQQASLLAYQNLTTFANGFWTLRDLALKLKQPLVPLTQSLMAYVNQGILGLTPVGDISFYEKPVQRSLIAYVEDSRFDSAAMERILSQAGYQFTSIRDSIQALPMLLEHNPDLIFLDLLMLGITGYEVCSQIRRISVLRNTPIIILTSSDGIVDRVRAKLAGASGFLTKPIEPNKVLEVLQQYLPSSGGFNRGSTF
jgi:CheY-like chemotaxis protein